MTDTSTPARRFEPFLTRYTKAVGMWEVNEGSGLVSDAIFICETCGKVYPDTCPTCPDRGSGRGVTVEKIKQDILACPTIGDVNHTAQHYRGHVKALEAAGREARAMAIQIKNLAWYRRTELRTRY